MSASIAMSARIENQNLQVVGRHPEVERDKDGPDDRQPACLKTVDVVAQQARSPTRQDPDLGAGPRDGPGDRFRVQRIRRHGERDAAWTCATPDQWFATVARHPSDRVSAMALD
jgi:hypothetical protein